MTDNVKNQQASGIRTASGTRHIDPVASEDDLTARVRIRDAALSHFAEEGFDRNPRFGPSPARRAYPTGCFAITLAQRSISAPRCDDYVFQVLHRLNTLFLDVPSIPKWIRPSRAQTRSGAMPARSLVDGSPTAAPIFDELVRDNRTPAGIDPRPGLRITPTRSRTSTPRSSPPW